MAIKPMTRSGWCISYPVTEGNKEQHDKCPLHFIQRDCTCDCGHPGERSLDSRGLTFQPPVSAKPIKIEKDEDDD